MAVRLVGAKVFQLSDCGDVCHAVLKLRLSQPHEGMTESAVYDYTGELDHCVVNHKGRRIRLQDCGLLLAPRELQERVKLTAIAQGSSVSYTCFYRSTVCMIRVYHFMPSNRDVIAIVRHLSGYLVSEQVI